jgi:crotonobetainyl-CoA:carnitine CoA-transferase CaiB-like acyl-CoA transferase
MVLGDLGARIIKVEQPGKGDDTRAWGPPFIGAESAYFLSINRNKESVTLNFKPEGREVLTAAGARGRAENRRPGTHRAGLRDACRQHSRCVRLDLGLRPDGTTSRRGWLRRGDAGGGRVDERHR